MIAPAGESCALPGQSMILVDGVHFLLPFEVPLAREVRDMPDWEIDVEDGIPPLEDGKTSWCGDASYGGRRWGRFGHMDNEIRVHLEGIGDLTACPITREATLHRASSTLDDVGLLRRLTPYLLAIHGLLVLHASCVKLPEGAVVFCGEATAGKSTLALALDAAGYPVLSDDHLVLEPIDHGILAHPSFPHIDVGQSSREVFRPETKDELGKISIPFLTPQPTQPVKATHLVFLKRGAAFSAKALKPVDVTTRLLRDVLFGASLMDKKEQELRLDGAIALSSGLSLVDLTLPDGLEVLAAQLSDLPALLASSL